MSPISKFLMINLTIFFAFLTSLGSADRCEVCMYDGTIYRDYHGAIAAPKFCRERAYIMTKMNEQTEPRGALCTYLNWNTQVKDKYGQKTFCRIQCERSTDCIPASRQIPDKDGQEIEHPAFLGRRDMACNEWPAN
ncbi:uncharacterized protein MELLADRAFT_107989 [Melampsora larici-populina 98AG31]|uniref:Secreted protein n=1 Tax=Melampsora larici-populina (strain 98AG31 / pathotype 3-4-7) TaxID=747676 RepID=F4RRL5_MELLP|nr:uncharacterized protein MELLADRAFT_107989 [Melampsora larici-populina 98AG31]EGG05001.1 secreted protein [Melampsora larici-populina 98AG31]